MMNVFYYAHGVEQAKRSAKDSHEGRFDYIIHDNAGKITAGGATVYPDPVYVLSLSGPKVNLDHLQSQYGKYVVRINDPRCFASDLSENLSGAYRAEFLKVHYGDFVELGHGMRSFKIDQKPAMRNLEWTYSHKHADFSNDEEYRVAVVSSERGGGYQGMIFDLGKPLEYAELL